MRPAENMTGGEVRWGEGIGGEGSGGGAKQGKARLMHHSMPVRN